MVASLRSYSKNGLRDWIIQRVTAVAMASYIFFLLGYLFTHAQLDFMSWHSLFSNLWMRLFTLLFLVCVMSHAWIGIWIISTDYLKQTAIRLIFQSVVFLSLIGFLAWGIQILWGVGL